MFKKLFLFLMLGISCSLYADVKDEGYTFRAFGGYNSVSLSSHPAAKFKVRAGQILGGAIGYKISPEIRVEGEATYRLNEVEQMTIRGKSKQFAVPVHGDIHSLSYIANAFYEPPLMWDLSPYFGAGMGVTCEYGDWQIAVIEDSVWIDIQGYERMAFSYQLTLGLRLPAGYDNSFCGVEFRFLDALLDHMCHRNRSVVFSWHKVF